MIGGYTVSEHWDRQRPQSAPKQLAVSDSVPSELEKELPVVAAMGQMINLAWNNVAIGPWHGFDLSPT
jgi:hypothetical protein